jgi:hypothetical protein
MLRYRKEESDVFSRIKGDIGDDMIHKKRLGTDNDQKASECDEMVQNENSRGRRRLKHYLKARTTDDTRRTEISWTSPNGAI